MIRAYDCTNYEYDTKTPGLQDRILSPCLNFLGGTQPSFIAEIFKDRLLTEGFASRTWFINEEEPRSYRYDIFTFSPEQLEARAGLVKHVGELIKLFGNLKQTSAAYSFMKNYVETILPNKNMRANQSTKLEHYYSRKKVHVEKLAGAIHFADSVEMTIDLPSYQKAIAMLDGFETSMDKSLNVGGRNPLAASSEKILQYLRKRGGDTFPGIWREFVDDLNEKELVDTIGYLIQVGKVDSQTDGKGIVKYYVKDK